MIYAAIAADKSAQLSSIAPFPCHVQGYAPLWMAAEWLAGGCLFAQKFF